ncbi:ExbD/TolR family protein [Planobacterium oryzisoli]|uniref:Biopolymer transporter ExbD n=1 Tax=Planobacterium oryzisoli TaxID=2771435 RepID=A0A931EBW7_9FLAO|nr:biopolymer transporter ExbD [Planobacterium oryzisoli]MBF5027444.1 biopolymer transporter ExbD [Planobacterium oryzisoli]
MELKRRNRISAEFSMASMTDIIFLLLIFFMITSSAISQSAIDVKLPEVSTEAVPAQDPTTISITKEGAFYLNDESIERTLLEQKLVAVLSGQQDKTFTIRADKQTPHGDVVFVMEIAEKHQYNLAIATLQNN